MDGGGRTKFGTRVEGARGRGVIKSPHPSPPLEGEGENSLLTGFFTLENLKQALFTSLIFI